jgi:hypothetical protein
MALSTAAAAAPLPPAAPSFAALPHGVIARFLALLPVDARARCAAVCPSWRAAAAVAHASLRRLQLDLGDTGEPEERAGHANAALLAANAPPLHDALLHADGVAHDDGVGVSDDSADADADGVDAITRAERLVMRRRARAAAGDEAPSRLAAIRPPRRRVWLRTPARAQGAAAQTTAEE